MIPESRPEPGRWLPIVAVFLLSVGLVGFELALLRALAITQWHHFSYFVISTALLGFGVSGTLLAFVGKPLARWFNTWATILTLAFSLSIYVCFQGAQALPLNPQFVLFSGEQVGLLIAYHVLLLVPFLLGATVIGLALMHFGGSIHLVYGSNLLGSGIGGLGALLLLAVLPVERIVLVASITALVAGAGWAAAALLDRSRTAAAGARRAHAPSRARAWGAVIAAGVALVVLTLAWPMTLRIDSHKPLATAQLLEEQGDAEHLLRLDSPRGRLDVFDSSLFHNTLFAGFTALSPPPPQLTVYVDGWSVGTVFKIDEPGEAEILDHTLMSVPYRLLERPRVLLLGEVGGANVWLAERWSADSVTVVNGNPQLVSLIAEDLAELSGGVFVREGVETIPTDPRLFLDAAGQTDYDLIQLVSAEGMSVGVSGLLAIHEDYLLTREGLAVALQRLRPGGLLAVTRQQQDPPRDNVKLLLTLAESLESLGVSDPGAHIVQLRNYLAVITLASRNAFDDAQCERILAIAEELQLDVEWLPMAGFEGGEPYARIPGPPGETVTYYRYAAQEAFSPRRSDLIADWVYDIRPATDERPYFYNFFRWGSIPALREAFGGAWVRKLELGYIAVVAILAEVVLVGGALILLPLLFRGRQSGGPKGGRLATGLYFFLLGLAYMSLEMLLIVRFTHFLGDPILSAGGVVSAFLVWSGFGSLLSRRLFRSVGKAIASAIVGICALGAAYAFVLPALFAAAASWSIGARMVVTVLLVTPLAFLMGIPFPSGMRRISQARPAFVPWAWGINGFASVAAPPVGILLATSIGLTWATLLGGGFYLCAGLLASRLPKG